MQPAEDMSLMQSTECSDERVLKLLGVLEGNILFAITKCRDNLRQNEVLCRPHNIQNRDKCLALFDHTVVERYRQRVDAYRSLAVELSEVWLAKVNKIQTPSIQPQLHNNSQYGNGAANSALQTCSSTPGSTTRCSTAPAMLLMSKIEGALRARAVSSGGGQLAELTAIVTDVVTKHQSTVEHQTAVENTGGGERMATVCSTEPRIVEIRKRIETLQMDLEKCRTDATNLQDKGHRYKLALVEFERDAEQIQNIFKFNDTSCRTMSQIVTAAIQNTLGGLRGDAGYSAEANIEIDCDVPAAAGYPAADVAAPDKCAMSSSTAAFAAPVKLRRQTVGRWLLSSRATNDSSADKKLAPLQQSHEQTVECAVGPRGRTSADAAMYPYCQPASDAECDTSPLVMQRSALQEVTEMRLDNADDNVAADTQIYQDLTNLFHHFEARRAKWESLQLRLMNVEQHHHVEPNSFRACWWSEGEGKRHQDVLQENTDINMITHDADEYRSAARQGLGTAPQASGGMWCGSAQRPSRQHAEADQHSHKTKRRPVRFSVLNAVVGGSPMQRAV